jgi:hypothetical protein
MLRPYGANFQLLFLQLSQAFGSRACPRARLWFKKSKPVRLGYSIFPSLHAHCALWSNPSRIRIPIGRLNWKNTWKISHNLT